MSTLPASRDTITIDEEFRAHCPPLPDSERQMLRQDIERSGLLSPLIVWNHEGKTILVDGHNRYEILQELEKLDELQTTKLVFGTRENALNWILNNQLGRRNLSPDAAALLRGKLYNSRKLAIPNQTGANQYSEVKAQSEQQPTTAESISAETGVSRETVKRDAKFAEAVEQLGITNDVLAGTERRTRKEIIEAVSPPLPPAPMRERPLEDILSKRWDPFIKDIPLTKHREVHQWVTRKLNQPRW